MLLRILQFYPKNNFYYISEMMSFLFVAIILIVPLTSFAQQNLFNIPSGEVTSEQDVFYQHQLNIYQGESIKSKQHFVYGLGNGFELGVNILDVSLTHFSQSHDQYRPLIMGTVQKAWQVGDKLFLNLGTQMGSRYRSEGAHESFNTYSYSLLTYKFDGHSRIVSGIFYTNEDSFLNGPENVGYLLGYEWFLTKRFGLMGDHVSGSTASSVSVIGVIYSVTKHFQICAGALIPNRRSFSEPGIVIEFNIFSFNAY